MGGGVPVLFEQVHVLDERLDGHPRAAHAFDELDALAIRFAVVAHAACGAGNGPQQPDALVVAQGVAAHAVFLAHLGDLHVILLKLLGIRIRCDAPSPLKHLNHASSQEALARPAVKMKTATDHAVAVVRSGAGDGNRTRVVSLGSLLLTRPSAT